MSTSSASSTANESCPRHSSTQNKPVFHIEYPDGAPNITPDVKMTNCEIPSTKGFSTVLKIIDLNS